MFYLPPKNVRSQVNKIIMKYFLISFLFIFLCDTLLSAELEVNSTSIFNIINEKKLPDGTHYRSFEVQGGQTYNTGKYARSNCSGNRVDKKDELVELNNICEIEFDDGNKMWTQLKRSNSDIDAGVGGSVILDGTGPYKKLKGTECLYAVSFLKEIVFTKTRCSISDKLFEELKTQ